LPHMANWDLLLARGWLKPEVVTVAERISPPRLFRIFMNLRTSLGMTVVPLDSGSDHVDATSHGTWSRCRRMPRC
jgi:lauroyl/myristoyl acyltransferase